MAQDLFDTNSTSSPARLALPITPNDATDFQYVGKGIYVGGAGDIVVIMANSTTPVTFRSTATGSILPIRVSRVLATGTTATNLVLLV